MYNFEFNKNDKRRCEIIGIPYPESYHMGGIKRYRHLFLDEINALIEEKFIDPNEAQNCCPCVSEIKDFMEKYPMFTAHGYIVSPERDDYRVSIEGVEYIGEVDQQMMIDFIEKFGDADEVVCDRSRCYCWYD